MAARRRLPAATVYLLIEGVQGVLFMMLATVASIYAIVEVGLNPLQLVLAGTVLETTALIFEVPTGVLADTVSRRRSILIGTFVTGAAYILWGSIPSFGAILAAQVIWGIGYTFISGADVAWITDEVGEEAARPLYVRAVQWGQVGALMGIVLSVALASVALWIPLVVSGIGYLALGSLLLIVMPEDHFRGDSAARERLHRSIGNTIRRTATTVRARPALLVIFAIAAFHGMATEGFDRLWELHLLRNFTLPAIGALEPIVWFGIVNAVGLALTAATAQVLKSREFVSSAPTAARSVSIINALLVVSVSGFALAGNLYLALLAYWCVSVLRTIVLPAFQAWINHDLDPAARATVNSMWSQVDAAGQIAGGPAIGALGLASGVRVAILASGLLRIPAMALFGRARRHDEALPIPVAEAEPAGGE